MRKLTAGEILMVNIGSTSSGGKVKAVKNDLVRACCVICSSLIEILRKDQTDLYGRFVQWLVHYL